MICPHRDTSIKLGQGVNIGMFSRLACINEISLVISREFSSEWEPGDEPYYPVNDAKNGALYVQYKALADKEEKVIFGGRLGEYKYYDMDATIAAVLEKCEQIL